MVDDTLAFLNLEELVAILVDFLANLIAGLESHKDQLQMMTGVKNPAKILILDGSFLDVVAIAFQRQSSFTGS